MKNAIIQNVKFDEKGLIPAIVQDAATLEVIALSYMDNATLAKTLQTGETSVFASPKFPFAAHSYRLLDVRMNGDGESLTVLIEREQKESSEREPISLYKETRESQKPGAGAVSLVDIGSMEFGLALNNLYNLIADRKDKRPEGSYTTYLFNSGLDKILKKIAEESGEVIIASKNKRPREIISELADLFYHLLVLMVELDVKLSDVRDELTGRATPQKQ
jgi:phosphoribosyl-AMP cyclohydrolase / phosphoribosyl-ATP pyrophosphohydrolase